MKIFDSHCHLDDRSYLKDMETVLRRAQKAGVKAVLIPGIGIDSAVRAISLGETYPNLFVSVGMHPHDAKDCSDAIIQSLRHMTANPLVKAWGEIGLDFNRLYSAKSVQEHWFLKQLETADELNLPVIFHERDSGGRLLDLLRAYPKNDRSGVVHCFSGTEMELKAYLDLGLYIGITGILTLKDRGTALRRLARQIPENRLVVETDAPYLTPSPERNKHRRNEPAFVKSVLLRLAAVRDTAPKELAAAVWENTCRLYDVDID